MAEFQSKTADDLAAEALAADMDMWIIFDPKSTQEPFDHWLQRHLPTNILREDGVGWISVLSPYETENLQLECDPVGLQNDWEILQESGRPISYRTITELAMQHGITSGKWLFHVDSGPKADLFWTLIARAVVEGHLGKSAKVSPNCAYEDNYKHVICIYNDLFTDKEAVYELENAIRCVGIKCPMTYKPDAFTYLGIYRKNKWNLRPTIYESVYELMSGASKIIDRFE